MTISVLQAATQVAQPKMPHPIHSVDCLSPGSRIQASRVGLMQLQGTVDVMHLTLELFWMVDDLGERRIIDLDTYLVELVV